MANNVEGKTSVPWHRLSKFEAVVHASFTNGFIYRDIENLYVESPEKMLLLLTHLL